MGRKYECSFSSAANLASSTQGYSRRHQRTSQGGVPPSNRNDNPRHIESRLSYLLSAVSASKILILFDSSERGSGIKRNPHPVVASNLYGRTFLSASATSIDFLNRSLNSPISVRLSFASSLRIR